MTLLIGVPSMQREATLEEREDLIYIMRKRHPDRTEADCYDMLQEMSSAQRYEMLIGRDPVCGRGASYGRGCVSDYGGTDSGSRPPGLQRFEPTLSGTAVAAAFDRHVERPAPQMIVVIHQFSGRIKFFQVGSWTLSGSLATYPDEVRPTRGVLQGRADISPPGLSALAFSPDSAMIAAGSTGGGAWWTHPYGMFGPGEFKYGVPANPLRVYRVSDGSLLASVGSFPGGVHRSGLVWSPNGEYLAFLDAVADIRFWNPFQLDLSVAVARKAVDGTLLFSRDGSQLAVKFFDKVKVFDVVPPH
jgi:hypothetical protein